MEREFRVLIACTGNIHRSALAATLFQQWVDWYLPADLAQRVQVSSAGFGAPVGARMGSRAQKIAVALGGDGSTHRATQITDRMLEEADVVLVATRRHLESAIGRMPSALRRSFTIRESGRIAHTLRPRSLQSTEDLRTVVADLARARSAATDPDADDIIDPQGQTEDAYLQMIREEIPPLAQLAHVLFGMPRPDVDAYAAASAQPALLLADDSRTTTPQ